MRLRAMRSIRCLPTRRNRLGGWLSRARTGAGRRGRCVRALWQAHAPVGGCLCWPVYPDAYGCLERRARCGGSVRCVCTDRRAPTAGTRPARTSHGTVAVRSWVVPHLHAAEPNRMVHSQGSLIKERKAEPAVHISWNDAVQCAIPRAVQHVCTRCRAACTALQRREHSGAPLCCTVEVS